MSTCIYICYGHHYLVKTKISGIAKINLIISGGGSMKLDLSYIMTEDSHLLLLVYKLLIIIYTSLIYNYDTDNDTIIKHNKQRK